MRNDHAPMVFAESTSYIVKGGQVKNLFGGDERKHSERTIMRK